MKMGKKTDLLVPVYNEELVTFQDSIALFNLRKYAIE